jgi:hypothetical protein
MPTAYLEPASNTERLRKIVLVLRAHPVPPWRKLVDHRALVQMMRSDQLGWHAERAEVVDEQAEGGGGAV